jgi:hypothetical protein
MAMSPTQVIETDRGVAPEAPTGTPTATAQSAASPTTAVNRENTNWLRDSYEYDTHAPAGRF